MRSRVAQAAAQSTARRIARLSPAERIAIAVRLADEGVASYMLTHGVERAVAIERIKATRRLGRRPSRSAAPDER
jgi:hypothetical protein